MTTKIAQVLILEVIPSKHTTPGIAYSYQYVKSATEWSSVPRTPVPFQTVDDLTRSVRELALAYEKPCAVSVRVEGRKPPGFDRRFGGGIIANFPEDCLAPA